VPHLARQIVELGFKLTATSSLEVVPSLLRDLGSPDAAVRADALTVFSYWIGNDHFSVEELDSLLDESLDRMLYELGRSGDDSVFVRSYSALLLLELLHRNLEKAFFDSLRLELVYNTVNDVFLREQDYRAVVHGKGWAYATAPIGDNFLQLSRTKALEPTRQNEILTTIGVKLRSTSTYVFRHLEDERLAYVMLAVLEQGTVTLDFFEHWVAELVTFSGSDYAAIVELPSEQHAAYNNVRMFLTNLSFQLRFRKNPLLQAEAFDKMLEEGLKRLDPGFYTDFAA